MIAPERYQSVGGLLRDALLTFKSNTALIEVRRKKEGARYSFLDVKRRAEAFARVLEAEGVGAGDRVAICLSNQPAYIFAAYGAFYRGAVVVPIDYKLTAQEQEALYAHAKPKVLVTETPSFRKYGKLDIPLVFVTEAKEGQAPEGTRRFEDIALDGATPTFVPRTREDQATLVYSSGTSGRPKGCMLSHDNYLEQYRTLSARYPLIEGDRYFSILPTNHAIDFMCGFLGPLAGGATVVHQRTLRPEFLMHCLKKYEITHMAVVPLLLEAFERRIEEKVEDRGEIAEHLFEIARQVNAAVTLRAPRPDISRRLLKPVHQAFGNHLRFLFVGGAFVDPDRARFFYELGIPVAIGYGLTEAGTVLTVNDMKPFRADTVGRALEGVDIEIRNPDPDTGIGEVWAKSRTVFMGYLDDEAATNEALVDGWLRTGDLGYLDPSQHLTLVGRSKNMIVTAGGKNIYPEDVEASFDGLPCDELCVFASSYLFPGESLSDSKLVLVTRGAQPELEDELNKRNRKLAEHKRIGGLLRLEDDFPRTASMKVKRNVLAERIRTAGGREMIETVGGA